MKNANKNRQIYVFDYRLTHAHAFAHYALPFCQCWETDQRTLFVGWFFCLGYGGQKMRCDVVVVYIWFGAAYPHRKQSKEMYKHSLELM